VWGTKTDVGVSYTNLTLTTKRKNKKFQTRRKEENIKSDKKKKKKYWDVGGTKKEMKTT